MLIVEDAGRKDIILVVKDLSSVRKFTDKYNIMVWLTCNMLSWPWSPQVGVHENTPVRLKNRGASSSLPPTLTPWHRHPAGFPVIKGFINLLVLQGSILSSTLMLSHFKVPPKWPFSGPPGTSCQRSSPSPGNIPTNLQGSYPQLVSPHSPKAQFYFFFFQMIGFPGL